MFLAGSNTKFPGTNSNTLTLTNMRMSATVEATARLATQMHLSIFGMAQADMNALTAAWANPPVVRKNIVTLEANDGSGWVQVFTGTIIEAQPEYRRAPNTYFSILGMVGYFAKINPFPPTGYPDQASIQDVASTIINKMGFVYVDGGAKAVFTNPYFKGTLWDQLVQACRAANADFYIQGDRITVVKGGQAMQNAAPSVVLNPQSGLIGYPVYERAGLNVTCLFNPAISCGIPLDIVSDVPSATGRWHPIAMTHNLESRTPNGSWVSALKCLRTLV